MTKSTTITIVSSCDGEEYEVDYTFRIEDGALVLFSAEGVEDGIDYTTDECFFMDHSDSIEAALRRRGAFSDRLVEECINRCLGYDEEARIGRLDGEADTACIEWNGFDKPSEY